MAGIKPTDFPLLSGLTDSTELYTQTNGVNSKFTLGTLLQIIIDETIDDAREEFGELLDINLSPTDIGTFDTGFELFPSLPSGQYYNIIDIVCETIKFSTNFSTTASALNINYGSLTIATLPTLLLTSGSIPNIFAKGLPTGSTVLSPTSAITIGTDDNSIPTGGDYYLNLKIRYKINTFANI